MGLPLASHEEERSVSSVADQGSLKGMSQAGPSGCVIVNDRPILGDGHWTHVSSGRELWWADQS